MNDNDELRKIEFNKLLESVGDDNYKNELSRFLLPNNNNMRTKVHEEFNDPKTSHKIIVPWKMKYTPSDKEPKYDAKQFNFDLDLFQKLSLRAIEKNESIVISAHTSCGKTVAAEYAIAKSIKNGKRAIYICPLTALCRQKYREMSKKFESVGMYTNDALVNSGAKCIITTTDMYRSIVCKESEKMKNVQWVIFDEIHYINDCENGMFYEESVMLTPMHVQMIFMSATIANAQEFAEWISCIFRKPVHLISTKKPVLPLAHYFYSDKMYLVKDRKICKRNFIKAMEKPIKNKKIKKTICKLADKIRLPAIFFCSSSRKCIQLEKSITKNYSNAEEKKKIKKIVKKVLEKKFGKNYVVPKMKYIIHMLKMGVGVHYHGMPVYLKEIVENLCEMGLIKVLFATETFSTGLNMPTNTVVITSLKKKNIGKTRILKSSEYIQMSGRAGRRGFENKGVVISLITSDYSYLDPEMLFSSSTSFLHSSFHMRYGMILNLKIIDKDYDIKKHIKRSFYYFQRYKKILDQKFKLIEKVIKKTSFEIKIENYEKNLKEKFIGLELFKMLLERENLYILRNKMFFNSWKKTITYTMPVVDVLLPRSGASLLITDINVTKFKNGYVHGYILGDSLRKHRKYPVEYVLDVRYKLPETNNNPSGALIAYKPPSADHKDDYEAESSSSTQFYKDPCESSESINSDTKNHSNENSSEDNSDSSTNELFNDDTLLALIKNIETQIKEKYPAISFEKCLFCMKSAYECLAKCVEAVPTDMILETALKLIKNKQMEKKIISKMRKIQNMEIVPFVGNLEKKISVLKNLKCMDDQAVSEKGRVASTITARNELLIAEIFCSPIFRNLTPLEMTKLISCFGLEKQIKSVQIKNNEILNEILATSVDKLTKAIRKSGIDLSREKYTTKFSYIMIDVMDLRIKDNSIKSIQTKCKLHQETIIKSFRKTVEITKQLLNTANWIKNNHLIDAFNEVLEILEKDITTIQSSD